MDLNPGPPLPDFNRMLVLLKQHEEVQAPLPVGFFDRLNMLISEEVLGQKLAAYQECAILLRKQAHGDAGLPLRMAAEQILLLAASHK